MVVVWFVSSESSGIHIFFMLRYLPSYTGAVDHASGSETLGRKKNKAGRVFQPLSEPLLLEIAGIAIYICCALAVCSETHRLL